MEYRTVMDRAEGEYEEKRSRFIAHVCPVQTPQQAEEFILKIKKENRLARHNVFAWLLKNGDMRASDDGEPSGTAGMPVLSILQRQQISDCCIVVTRYFGGILLGAGGLTRAYSKAARIGMQNARVCTMRVCDIFSVCCGYDFYGKLQYLFSEHDAVEENTEFTDVVTVQFALLRENTQAFLSALTQQSAGKLTPEKLCERYAPFEDQQTLLALQKENEDFSE